MRTATKTPKKEAACVSAQTAEKTKLHNKPYQKGKPLSSLKIQIGYLLLSLQNQSESQRQWQVFESKLRRYINRKVCEVNL